MTSVFALKPVRDALKASPLCVVDVGAAGGVQRYLATDDTSTYIQYYGFEPNPTNFAALKDSANTKYFQMALSNRVGEAEFFARSTVGSLVRRVDRERAFGEHYETMTVRVESLANLRQQGVLPALDLVKTDVERHDLQVFEGAGKFSGEILCAIAEFEYYNTKDGGGFARIDDLLTENGLIFFSVAQKSGALGELAGGDLLYLKDIGALLRQETDSERLKQRVIKLFAIAVTMNFYKYAYVVARAAAETGVLNDDEARALLRYAEERVFLPFAVPRLKIRKKLSQLIALLAQVAIGPSWGGKNAVRENRIISSNRLFAQSRHLLPSWRRRHREHLERSYRIYLGHRGVFYEQPNEQRTAAPREEPVSSDHRAAGQSNLGTTTRPPTNLESN